MKNVLWLSRHLFTDDKVKDLVDIYGDDLAIIQVNRTINSAFDIRKEIAYADIICIVLPKLLQQQVLKLAGNKPVLLGRVYKLYSKISKTTKYIHAGWDQIISPNTTLTLSWIERPKLEVA